MAILWLLEQEPNPQLSFFRQALFHCATTTSKQLHAFSLNTLVGKGKLVLKLSAPHFLQTFRDIACQAAELNAVLYLSEQSKLNYFLNIFIPPNGNRIKNYHVYNKMLFHFYLKVYYKYIYKATLLIIKLQSFSFRRSIITISFVFDISIALCS